MPSSFRIGNNEEEDITDEELKADSLKRPRKTTNKDIEDEVQQVKRHFLEKNARKYDKYHLSTPKFYMETPPTT